MSAAMESLTNLRSTLADLQIDPQLRDILKYVPVDTVIEVPDGKFGLSFMIRVGNVNSCPERAQVYVCLVARPAGVTTVQIQYIEKRINGTMLVVDDSFQNHTNFEFAVAFSLKVKTKTSININALARYYFLLKLIEKQNYSDLVKLKSRELFPSMQITQFHVVCRRFKEIDDVRQLTRSEQQANWEAIRAEVRENDAEALRMKREDSDIEMVSDDAPTARHAQQHATASPNRSFELPLRTFTTPDQHQRHTATNPGAHIDLTNDPDIIPSIEVQESIEASGDHSIVAEYLVIEQRLHHYAARRTSYERQRDEMKKEHARLAHAMGSVQAQLRMLDTEEVKDKAKQAQLWEGMSKEQVEAVGVERERDRKRTRLG